NIGRSRCYPFWQELLGCYVINSAEGEAGKKKCAGAMEDYYECLHHKKEVCGFAHVLPGPNGAIGCTCSGLGDARTDRSGYADFLQTDRPRERERCKSRTERLRPHIPERTHRGRNRSGTWGY